jgi:hypothetical protein
VQHLGRLLAAERRTRGTRTGTRASTCFYQALMVLIWFLKAADQVACSSPTMLALCTTTSWK